MGEILGRIMGKIWSITGSSLAIITYSTSEIGNLNANSTLQDQILLVNFGSNYALYISCIVIRSSHCIKEIGG